MLRDPNGQWSFRFGPQGKGHEEELPDNEESSIAPPCYDTQFTADGQHARTGWADNIQSGSSGPRWL